MYKKALYFATCSLLLIMCSTSLCAGERTRVLPHIAMGGGWETILSISNLTNTQLSIEILTFDPTGQREGISSALIAPGGSLQQALSRTQPFVGYAYVNVRNGASQSLRDDDFIVMGIFRYEKDGAILESGMESIEYSQEITRSRLIALPYSSRDSYRNGIALAYADERYYGVSDVFGVQIVVLNDSGVEVLNARIDFGVNRRYRAIVLEDAFPQLAGVLGTLYILPFGSPGPTGIVSFRFSPTGQFTTLPALVKWR